MLKGRNPPNSAVAATSTISAASALRERADADQNQKGQCSHDHKRRLHCALERRGYLVGEELLHVPFTVTRLLAPRSRSERREQVGAQLPLHVGDDPSRDRRDDHLQAKADEGETQPDRQQEPDGRVRAYRPEIHPHSGDTIH